MGLFGAVHMVGSHDGAPHDVSIPRGMKALDVWGNAIKIELAAGQKRSDDDTVTVGPELICLVK